MKKLHEWLLTEESAPHVDTAGVAHLSGEVPSTLLGGRVCPDFHESGIFDAGHRVPKFGRRSWGLIADVYVRNHRAQCWPITDGGSDENVPGWRLGVRDGQVVFQLSDGAGHFFNEKNTHVCTAPGLWHSVHVHVLRGLRKIEVIWNGARVILADIPAEMGHTGDANGLQYVNHFAIGCPARGGELIPQYGIDGSVTNVSLWAL